MSDCNMEFHVFIKANKRYKPGPHAHTHTHTRTHTHTHTQTHTCKHTEHIETHKLLHLNAYKASKTNTRISNLT